MFALNFAIGLIVASAILGVRNIYTYWGSWEPVRRAIKPNPLRPVVYIPRHGTMLHRDRPTIVRWADLNIELGRRQLAYQIAKMNSARAALASS